jgi:hypothetical protein
MKMIAAIQTNIVFAVKIAETVLVLIKMSSAFCEIIFNAGK